MIPSLAWKNIWRNKTRSMVIVFSTTVGLLGGILATAFMLGLVKERTDSAINLEIGHLQIHNTKFPANEELQYDIPDALKIKQTLLKQKGIEAVSCRTRIQALAATAGGSAFVEMIAVDPDDEKNVLILPKYLADSGSSYFGKEWKNQVLISKMLANQLNVTNKLKIILRFQDEQRNIIEGAFKICGLFDTHNDLYDGSTLFIRNEDLSRILQRPAPYNEIVIRTRDASELAGILQTVKGFFPEYLVQDWQGIEPEIAVLVGATTELMYIFLAIILIALAFGIINTMLMSVLERQRELGMLMAIGMNRGKIFRMILLETTFLTITGGIIGILTSSAAVGWLHRNGIDLGVIGNSLQSIGYKSFIYPYIPEEYFLVLSLMIILTGLLSAIYPAKKALDLNPAEAIAVN
jgi:putative ABC transport system permease protein